jgi:ribose transport system permease protein
LQTSGTLFSNIIPSLVGLFLSRFIDDSLGTLIGALTISLLYYGLESVGILSGTKTIYYAIFLAVFIFVSGFWDQIINFFKKIFKLIVEKTKPKTSQA